MKEKKREREIGTDLQSFKKFLQVRGHFWVWRSMTRSPKLVTISTDISSLPRWFALRVGTDRASRRREENLRKTMWGGWDGVFRKFKVTNLLIIILIN